MHVWLLEKFDYTLAHLRVGQQLQGEGPFVHTRILEKLDGPLTYLAVG
jgi:hypothetical protein